jgi:hypothetical protein
MKSFVQTLTRSTNNATQQILRLIQTALFFTREVTFQRTTGGFFVPSNYALQRAVLTKEVTIKQK